MCREKKKHNIKLCVVYMENLSEYVHLYGIFERLETIHTYATTHINSIADLLTDDPYITERTIYLHIIVRA